MLLNSRIFFFQALIALSLLYNHETLARGATGHCMISKLAIQNFPSEIPGFIRTKKSAEFIGDVGREPDRSKGSGISHGHDIDLGHFINLSDNSTVVDVVSIDPILEVSIQFDSRSDAAMKILFLLPLILHYSLTNSNEISPCLLNA
jgi:hypothetical protein